MNKKVQQRKIIPTHRIFHIENVQRIKFSLINHEQEKNVLTSTHQTTKKIQSKKSSNDMTFVPPVIRVEQSLSPPILQFIPHSISNDKQTTATKRMTNHINATHFLHSNQILSLAPTNFIEDNQSINNRVRFYQIDNIVTSTNTFLMHQNAIIAHETRSDSFLSDTIFIILIVTLTIIILLFCLGLFCFCRRSTKRHISPSFDGSSYMKLNRHSYERSLDNYQPSKHIVDNIKSENNIPFKTHQPFVSNPMQMKSPDLHRTIKQVLPIQNKKLKKKRAGCCCCCCCSQTKDRSSMTINARTRT